MYSVICADGIYSYKCLIASYVKDNVKHVTRSAECELATRLYTRLSVETFVIMLTRKCNM